MFLFFFLILIDFVVNEFKSGGKRDHNKWADKVANHPFRSNNRSVEGITKDLISGKSTKKF